MSHEMCDGWSCCLDDGVLWFVVKVYPQRTKLAEIEEVFARLYTKFLVNKKKSTLVK